MSRHVAIVILCLFYIAGVVFSTSRSPGKRVLFIDPLSQKMVSQIRTLTGVGDVAVLDPSERGNEALVAKRIADYRPNGLVVRSSKITAGMMCRPLDLILRAGAGYNNIDVDHASSVSITVCNTPGSNAIAVAELTLGLMLASDRKIVESTMAMREGKWEKQRLSEGQQGLFGSTIGIIGAGSIAKAVIQRCLCMGINIVVWSRRLEGQAGDIISTGEARELFGVEFMPPGTSIKIAASPLDVASSGCEIFSVHVSTKEPLIDAACLRELKPGCLVINTARSTTIDNTELARQVRDPARRLRVALDVYRAEPINDGAFPVLENELIRGDAIIGTHHTGASTQQAQHQTAEEVIETLRRWSDGEGYNHRVN